MRCLAEVLLVSTGCDGGEGAPSAAIPTAGRGPPQLSAESARLRAGGSGAEGRGEGEGETERKGEREGEKRRKSQRERRERKRAKVR